MVVVLLTLGLHDAYACSKNRDIFKLERVGNPRIDHGIGYTYLGASRCVQALKYVNNAWASASDTSFSSTESPIKVSAAKSMNTYTQEGCSKDSNVDVDLYVRGDWNDYYDDDTLTTEW